MELESLSTADFSSELGLIALKSIGSHDAQNEIFTRYLISTIRKQYACSDTGMYERTVKVRVFNHLKFFLKDQEELEKLNEWIADAHELLEDIGEIVQVESDESLKRFRSQISMYVMLPATTRDRFTKALLLGPCWSLKSDSIPETIQYEDESGLRYLKGSPENLVSFLDSIEIYSIPFDQWRGYPPKYDSNQLIQIVTSELLAEQDSREVKEFKIVSKGHQKYFRKRIRNPKSSDNGLFIVRKAADYGSDIPLVALLQNGTCRKIISLPLERITNGERDCERLIISALDVDSGEPGVITVSGPQKYRNFFDYAFISFYIPPVTWVKRLLLGYGHVLSKAREGALTTFAIPWELKDNIVDQVARDMFLKVE